MPLTDTAIKDAKPRAKAYKLGDAGGLYLHVMPSGGRLWRMKFRVAGKGKLLSLGTYPAVSLATARKKRDAAKEALAAGIDPAREKQQAKHREKVSAANTFGEVASEFIAKRRREGLSKSTADKSEYYIGRMGLSFGRMPISDITVPDLLAVLRRIEATGNYETAHRVLQLAGRVFRYGAVVERLSRPVAQGGRHCAVSRKGGRLNRFHRAFTPDGSGPAGEGSSSPAGPIPVRTCALKPYLDGMGANVGNGGDGR